MALALPLTRPVASKKLSPHLWVAGIAAAFIAFLSAYEPNLTLRFGPVLALAAFVLSNPLSYRIGRTEWTLFAFVLWCAASVTWTQHADTYELNIITVLSLAVIFLGVRSAIRWTPSFAIFGYTAGCLVGLARLASTSPEDIVFTDVGGRVTQVGYLNANYVAYGAVAAVLLLALMLKSRPMGRLPRLAVLAIMLVLVWGIVFVTQTRGAQIALVALGVWLVIVKLLGRPLKTVVAVCLALGLSISLGWLTGLLSFLDYGDRGMAGLSGRTGLWAVAREAWTESLLLGVGLGGVRERTPSGAPAHNTFLELGATVGLIGVALFFAFIFLSQTDRLAMLNIDDRRLRVGAIVVAFTPVLLSSTWELSASAWIALALLSQPVLAAEPNPHADFQ